MRLMGNRISRTALRLPRIGRSFRHVRSGWMRGSAAVLVICLVLASCLSLAGCSRLERDFGNFVDSALDDGTDAPAATLGSSGADISADVSSDLEQATVERVVDGDTLLLRGNDGKRDYVRLIGIDAPESVAEDESRNCEEGRIASEHLKSMLSSGQTIWLQKDVSDTDRYGRLLRYVWIEEPTDVTDESQVESRMLNAILVAQGYAQARDYRPDIAYSQVLHALGTQAARQGLGVSAKWSS